MHTARRCVVALATLLAVTAAPSRTLVPGASVWLSGCVLDGEHFGPAQVDVTVTLPDRGLSRVVRTDRAGRFVVAVPHHARVVLSVAPAPPDPAAPARGAQSLEVTTGAIDLTAAGCLVVW